MDDAQEKIAVVARLRPTKPSPNVHHKETEFVVQVPRGSDTVNNQVEEYSFRFARVFGPQATQREVFDVVAKDLVLGALDGVNCSIFAYGQTGSGKTYTICGDHKERGIIPRALNCLFEAIEGRGDGVDYSVSLSFIEVYKEVGYDLLSKDFGRNQDTWPVVSVSLQSGEAVLQGAKRVQIASEDEGLHQYFLGDTHRTVAETPHNLNSSRSHCIFTIFIEASNRNTQTLRSSKVQIVDLAGSERLKPYEDGSQQDKVLMGQAVSINVSLHWLEGVINALNRKSTAVPYRNSFLTKVLKDALGGNAKAIMVATLNPCDQALPETISTCRFAQRVANVQTFARVNEQQDPQLVISQLRQENSQLRAALGASEHAEDLGEEELRRRCRTFLEEEMSAESEHAIFSVTLLQAFRAFRTLRELCWEMMRKGLVAKASEKYVEVEGPASGGSGEGLADTQLREALAERDAECRTLRAALAAQPRRPAPTRPKETMASASRSTATSVSCSTQTEEMKGRSKPRAARERRPASAGPRDRNAGGRCFIGFSPEDVVDPFGRLEGKTVTLPPLPRDARGVPDFRSKEPSKPNGVTSVEEPVQKSFSAPSQSAPIAQAAEHTEISAGPVQEAKAEGGASAAWLSATTALTEEERQLMGDAAKAYQLFLLHDPPAAEIWPDQLQNLRQERRARMEEAKALGEEIQQTNEAKQKVQDALATLNEKLREAKDEAAVGQADAAKRAETLQELLSKEEPRLIQLFDEKRQRYELDFGRLRELKREISHLEHAEKKLETTVQSEFQHWRKAVAQRYPGPGAHNGEQRDKDQDPQDHSDPGKVAEVAAPMPIDVDPKDDPQVAKVEKALETLRLRLQEAEDAKDEPRRRVLAQLLLNEEPKLARLRARVAN